VGEVGTAEATHHWRGGRDRQTFPHRGRPWRGCGRRADRSRQWLQRV